MHIVTRAMREELLEEAARSPRRRKNLNVHDDDTKINVLLNAIFPDSYVPPHKHTDKREYFNFDTGRFIVVTFDDEGVITNAELLCPEGSHDAVIEVGEWHTVIALEPSILREAKDGPYIPETAKVFAPWAPSEEEPERAEAYLAKLLMILRKEFSTYF